MDLKELDGYLTPFFLANKQQGVRYAFESLLPKLKPF